MTGLRASGIGLNQTNLTDCFAQGLPPAFPRIDRLRRR